MNEAHDDPRSSRKSFEDEFDVDSIINSFLNDTPAQPRRKADEESAPVRRSHAVEEPAPVRRSHTAEEPAPVRRSRAEEKPAPKKDKPRNRPIFQVILIDLLCFGAALVVFALFHHVLPRSAPSGMTPVRSEPVAVMPVQSSAPAETAAPVSEEPSPAPGEEPSEPQEVVEEPDVNAILPPFTEEIISTDTTYSSPDIAVEISDYEVGSGIDIMHYYVADIHVKDPKCIQSYFAGNVYTLGGFAYDIVELDKSSNAIAAINGDYFSFQVGTCVLRNGVIYRYPTADADICVLTYDGVMKTYRAAEIASDEAIEAALTNAWQGWSFGPALLDADGKAYTDLETYTTLSPRNPRTGIGYYEPGHYCFVVVDGRQDGYSYGCGITNFAKLFEELGCKAAYNLDGGGSSRMSFNDRTVTRPFENRTLPDIILVTEYEGSIAQQAEQSADTEH